VTRFCRPTVVSFRRQVVLLAATMLLVCNPIPSRAAGPASNSPPAATRKVIGYALDESGRPVAGATVCLRCASAADDGFVEFPIIAQTQTQRAGRFELLVPEGDVSKEMTNFPPVFNIWIHMAGLAQAHRYIFGEPDREPQIISMTKEVATTIFLRKPDGSPCRDATVTPIYIWQPARRWSGVVPKMIQDQLRTRSQPDGRATVAGLSGRPAIIAIETADFGQQKIVIPAPQDPPFAVTLFEPTQLEGRVILHDGHKADLSKLEVTVTIVSSETAPDAKPGQQQQPHAPPPPGTGFARYVVHPDYAGRYSIAKFPRFNYGDLQFYVGGPDEIAIAEDGHASFQYPENLRGKRLKLDVPIQMGRRVARTVRDAQTKRPLARVGFAFRAQELSRQDTTDENGQIRLTLCPGARYQFHCELPDGYLRTTPGSEDDVVIPPGVGVLELKPVELIHGITLQGKVLDVAGQYLAGIRVRGTWRAGNPPGGKDQAPEISRWTSTDAEGHFHFDGIEAGAPVALVPVSAGVALADPLQIAAAEDKPVRLQEQKCDLVALGGRVLDTNHQPIAGARVVIEVEHSLDPTRTFRTTVGSDGLVETPARFPKQLKYRLTARAILKDVASSAWICPATSGSRFPDLVVERSQLGLHTKLSGKEVVALVDGRPILASEILQRAYQEPLSPDGLSLLTAAKHIENGRMSEVEYRELQELAIWKYAANYARTRMLSRAYEASLGQEWRGKTEEAVSKMFDEYLEKLEHDLKASSQAEVDRKLHELGTSLASLKVEFRHRLLADEWRRRSAPAASDISWQRVLAYYQEHRQQYALREKVNWQLLEIEFDERSRRPSVGGQQAAEWGDDSRNQAAQTNGSQDPANRLTEHLDWGSLDPKRDQKGTPVEKHPEPPAVTDASGSISNVGRERAKRSLDKAIACQWLGLPFDKIVKQFSAGPHADQGGWQPRLNPNSVSDEKTSAALRQLPEGTTSGVIETDHSFRIIHVACRTPASYQPFEEVEQTIREHMRSDLQAKAIEELSSQTVIESPYIDDHFSGQKRPIRATADQSQDDAFAR
jgi:hypothetical protein